MFNSIKKILVLQLLHLSMQTQAVNDTIPQSAKSLIFKTEADYLVPTQNGNDIRTVSLHAFLWKQHFKKATIFIKAGITATYGWGYSRQWYPLNENVWQAIDYETSAFGLGLVMEIEQTIIKTRYIDVNVEASAGCIRYDKHFPYGGDIYDFMLRTGPSLALKISKKYSIDLGYRWMHVSNGQGSGNHNPFYEAQGFNLGITLRK